MPCSLQTRRGRAGGAFGGRGGGSRSAYGTGVNGRASSRAAVAGGMGGCCGGPAPCIVAGARGGFAVAMLLWVDAIRSVPLVNVSPVALAKREVTDGDLN